MKWLKRIGLGFVLLLLGLAASVWLFSRDKPARTSGPEADALAHEIERAVGLDGWRRTNVIKWCQDGRRFMLWDRARGLARVQIGDSRTLLRTHDFSGRAYLGGVEITDPERRKKALEKARRWFVNDSFWLYPFAGFFDAGVTRGKVTLEGGEDGLFIEYASGGVTPGDGYLWIVGPDRLPKAWRVWVQVLPVKGLRFSWEDWLTLPSGAKIAINHHTLVNVAMRDVLSGDSLAEVEPGPDPFAPLFE